MEESSHSSIKYSKEIEILEEEEEEQKDYTPHKYLEFLSQPKIKVIGSIIAFLCILASLLIGSFCLGFYISPMSVHQSKYVYYYPTEYQLDRSEGTRESFIMETREFQQRLTKEDYEDRWAAINPLKDFVRDVMGEDLKESDWKTTIYSEQQLDSTDCGFHFSELRKRRLFDDLGVLIEGKTTVDINRNESDKEKALEWDLTPSEEYHHEMKLEQDIHAHSHKFNIKTKVKSLENDFRLETCQQVNEMFPHAFESIDFNEDGVLSGQDDDDVYVWQHAYSGDAFFFGTTKLKISWTLYFANLEDALDVHKLPSSGNEFSIRIYSTGAGYGPWHYEALDYVAATYRAVKDFYDE